MPRMGLRRVLLTGMLCLFATTAPAAITSVSPSTFSPSGEDYLQIFGTDLLGTEGTQIVFDGQYVVAEPNLATPTKLISWIPVIVLLTEGTHSVAVHSIDAAQTRIHGPAYFTVALPVSSGPPTVYVPEAGAIAEAVSSAGANVAFTVTALSANGDEVPVTCSPASGSLFPLGLSQVNCSASDSGGTGTGGFRVLVTDTAPPIVSVPANISSPDPIVTFTATAADHVDGPLPVSCTPASGSSFPQGTTQVRCSAVDGHNNAGFGTFSVTVTAGPPLLILPPDQTAEATSAAGATVEYEASVAGGGPISCAPASGSTFPLGVTVVTCTATNVDGTTNGTFNVTVEDTTPPQLVLPSLLTEEATSAAGATVTFVATATDLVDGDLVADCVPASGSLFGLGTTTVACSATDTGGNVSEGAFDVEVEDTTPPSLVLPAPITMAATSPAGTTVTFVATATDLVDGNRPVDCVPPSGSLFPFGTTTVVCAASDSRGNETEGSFQVQVVDVTPPEILSIDVSPEVLWPPDHRMVPVTVSVVAVDDSDPAPWIQIVGVSSNQPLNGTGDGDTSPDWILTGPLTLQLRAERSHGNTRIYTIEVEVTDASGNTSSDTIEVRVANVKRRGAS